MIKDNSNIKYHHPTIEHHPTAKYHHPNDQTPPSKFGRDPPPYLYIDDGTVARKGLEEAKQFSGVVRDTLERAGLVVSDEKSVWEPVSVTVVGVCDRPEQRYNKCPQRENRKY